MRMFFLVPIFLGTFLCVNPVVILVHGSFSGHSSWWRPGGSFFEPLQKHAQELGHAVVPFMWSGQPDSDHIHLAAERLAALIKSYAYVLESNSKADVNRFLECFARQKVSRDAGHQEIMLIGHSHGGNVINVASQKLKEQQSARPDPLELSLDMTPTLRLQKNYIIKRVYLLGTPVEKDFYGPDMDIIESVINFYSKGDYIQPVLGIFDRTYAGHDRIANVSVSFKKILESDAKEPGHCRLYDPMVARLILFVPDVLQEHAVGSFELFTYAHDGHILFDELIGAVYSPVS